MSISSFFQSLRIWRDSGGHLKDHQVMLVPSFTDNSGTALNTPGGGTVSLSPIGVTVWEITVPNPPLVNLAIGRNLLLIKYNGNVTINVAGPNGSEYEAVYATGFTGIASVATQ